jgi:hypothetical protein
MDERLVNLDNAINNLEGALIPFNLSKNCIEPLREWLHEEIQSELMEDKKLR